MIDFESAKSVEVKRDKDGMWLHPSFPWDDIGEGETITPFAEKWGYQCGFITMANDASDEIQKRYEDANSPDFSYWNPSKPEGEGWILGALYDTEDGPVACWLRLLKKTNP